MVKEALKEQVTDDQDSHYEKPFVAVRRLLRKNNYDFYFNKGYPKLNYHKVIKILKPREPRRKKFLKIIPYNSKQGNFHIGNLWFESKFVGAKVNEKWVLNVFGKDYVPELEELINEASKPYKVKIKMVLKQEFPKEERKLKDYIIY